MDYQAKDTHSFSKNLLSINYDSGHVLGAGDPEIIRTQSFFPCPRVLLTRSSTCCLVTEPWLPHPIISFTGEPGQEPNASSLAQNCPLYSHYFVLISWGFSFSSGKFTVSPNLPLLGSQTSSQKGKMTRKEYQGSLCPLVNGNDCLVWATGWRAPQD